MQIFGWVRRMFAEAAEGGIRDGLVASGFRPVEDEAAESPRMILWLTNGQVKLLPPAGEKTPQDASQASESASKQKGRGK